MIVQQEVVSIEVDAGGGGLTAEFWAVLEEIIFGGDMWFVLCGLREGVWSLSESEGEGNRSVKDSRVT